MEPLDQALTLGVLAIENGGSTTMAEHAFQSVLAGSRIHDGFAVWRLDFAAGGRSTAEGAGLVHPVGRLGANFRRVSEISRLADRAAAHSIEPGAVAGEIARIRQLRSPYGAPVMLAAMACTAGLFSRLQGGNWRSFTLAAVATAVGQLLRFRLDALKASVPAITLACAAASALVAAVGLRLRPDDFAPATLIASIIYLVPGLALINGFVDLASHTHLIIGVQRIASAALQCALLAIAVALAVTVVW